MADLFCMGLILYFPSIPPGVSTVPTIAITAISDPGLRLRVGPAWKRLGLSQAVKLLEATLAEEKKTDETTQRTEEEEGHSHRAKIVAASVSICSVNRV
jgi:hypothetical protein